MSRTLLWMVVIIALDRCCTHVEANNAIAIIQFINNITLTGRTLSTNGSTSEDLALKWLVTANSPQYQFVPGSKVNNTRLAQRYALATYYVENSRMENQWLSNQSECTWRYVGCSSDSNVTSFGNDTASIFDQTNGTLTVDLGLLSSLQFVYSSVYGQLPSTIGKWTNLEYAGFDCFLGPTTLPSTIGNWRNLRKVWFRNGYYLGWYTTNFFTGPLPATIGNWTNLQTIDISGTGLNGTLPTSIGNWANVEMVTFSSNQLSGSLPTTIGRWSSLRELLVYGNEFTGNLPELIGGWTLVERIMLRSNMFSGSLPIGNWNKLTNFIVDRNNFTGTISPAVANWTSIQRVELQNNSFIGTIPRSICRNGAITLYADCPNEVACWCCTGCTRPNIAAGDVSGILFRELRADAQDGSWGPNSSDIPGFDHVALSYLDSVFESHPGYTNGPVYVSADRLENRTIPVVNGVQNAHTIETFKHDSRDATSSPVINFQVFPIDNATALAMKNIISPRLQVAGFLGFDSVEEFVGTHAPSAQKGGNGKFTGVGLVEWAAEQAGVNNGQGFVPNDLESITTTNETFPLLSPELMYSALQNQRIFFSTQYFLKGYFDPVDHLLTDPLGRKTGVVNQTQHREIPNAFSSPKGDVETLVVVNPLPGTYKLTVYSIPGKKGRAALQVLGRQATTFKTTGDASAQDQFVQVPENLGSRGDVNGDGAINRTDLMLLKGIISKTTVVYNRTADMDGDGQLNQVDYDILELYLNRITMEPTLSPNRPPVAPTPRAGDPSVPVVSPMLSPNRAPTPSPKQAPTVPPNRAPTPSPNQAPVVIVPTPQARNPTKLPTLSPTRAPVAPPGSCPTTDKCNRGFTLHRTLFSRCIQRCTPRFLMRWRLRGKAWKCGKC